MQRAKILFVNFAHDRFLHEVSERIKDMAEVYYAGYSWITRPYFDNKSLFLDYAPYDNPSNLDILSSEILEWELNDSAMRIQNDFHAAFLIAMNRVSIGRFENIMISSYYSILTAFFRRKLKESQINLIFFDSTPHMPLDLALAVAAMQLQKKIVFIVPTTIPNHVVFKTQIWTKELVTFDHVKGKLKRFNLAENAGQLLVSKADNSRSLGNFILSKGSNQNRIERLKYHYDRNLFNLKDIFRTVVSDKWREHYFHLSRIEALREILKQRKNDKNLQEINRRIQKYNQLESSAMQKFKKNYKYIYFPLQFQPERTTIPESQFFSDQISGILAIRSYVGADVPIIVKEHPRQLRMRYTDIRRKHFRSSKFYETIQTLENVRLVPAETKTSDLIKNASLIVSSTGSSMWEGMIQGIPCVSLARNWHCSFKWSPYLLDIQDPNEYINEAISTPSRRILEDLDLFLEEIKSSLIESADCELVANLSKMPIQSLVNNFEKAIIEIIEKL